MNDFADPTPRTRGRSPAVRGVIAGIAAATAVALFFLVIDWIGGSPLRTPGFLAGVVLGQEDVVLTAGPLALYTVLHYALFILVGIGLAGLVERLPLVPAMLVGLTIGFLLFDLLFYGGIWITGVDVISYLGWPAALAGNALAGIALVGTLHLLAPRPRVSWRNALAGHNIVREGLVVGLIGAAAVALWFLALDLAAGRLFFTPAALGSLIFEGAASAAEVRVDAATVLGYTALHVGAFLLTGLMAAVVVGYAEDRHAYVLLGAVLLFVTFETFFLGLLTIMAQWFLEVIPWWSIALANLLAAGVMGVYLWRRHPASMAAFGDPELERKVEQPSTAAGVE